MIIEYSFFDKYDIQKFNNDVPTDDFDCGNNDLNDFIKNEAELYKLQLITIPYIVTEKTK